LLLLQLVTKAAKMIFVQGGAAGTKFFDFNHPFLSILNLKPEGL
jgi:hypothetical protein